MQAVVPQVNGAVEDEPVLLDGLGQFQAFLEVLDDLALLGGDFKFLGVFGGLVGFLLVDFAGFLEAELEVLIGQLVDFHLGHEVIALRLGNDQFNAVLGLPIVPQHQLACLLREVVQIPFESELGYLRSQHLLPLVVDQLLPLELALLLTDLFLDQHVFLVGLELGLLEGKQGFQTLLKDVYPRSFGLLVCQVPQVLSDCVQRAGIDRLHGLE